jgi:hypothetical protein
LNLQKGATMTELSAKQEKCIAALLSEPTIAAAANAIRVSERVVHNWLHEPAFADVYRSARREAVRQAIARLQHASTDAVNVLCGVMADTGAPPSTRIAAARTVLEHAIHGVELDDLAARLDALEGAAHAKS